MFFLFYKFESHSVPGCWNSTQAHNPLLNEVVIKVSYSNKHNLFLFVLRTFWHWWPLFEGTPPGTHSKQDSGGSPHNVNISKGYINILNKKTTVKLILTAVWLICINEKPEVTLVLSPFVLFLSILTLF